MIKHLSHSQIESYQLCPRAYKFAYVEKIPAPTSSALLFGTAFHRAVQTHLRNPRNLHETWKEQFELTFSECKAINFRRDETPRRLFDQGANMLQDVLVKDGVTVEVAALLETVKPDQWEGDQLAIEIPVKFDIIGVEVPIIGYVDLVSGGIPIDIKTAGRRWPAGKEHKTLQPDFYLAGLAAIGKPAPEFQFYIFTKGKAPRLQVLRTKRTPEQLEWTFDLIRETYQAIKAGAFPPNTSGWKCDARYCDWWEHCRALS